MMNVTWLHVSDFHFRGGDPYDREVILRALVQSVKRFYALQLLSIPSGSCARSCSGTLGSPPGGAKAS
jgi:hypothetical protein